MMADGYANVPAKTAPAQSQTMGDDEGYSVEELRKKYLSFVFDKNLELQEQRSARHYYHGDQLTSAEVAELRKRKQPIIIANRIARKIDGVVGFIERLKQDPKAYPRNPPPQQQQGAPQGMPGQSQPPDQGTEADLSTAVVRYALDACDWNEFRPEACRNAAINGIGGIEMQQSQGDHGDPDLSMAIVDTETFFYDQRSVRNDFSDARFMGVAKWVDEDVALGMFPDMQDEVKQLVSSGGTRADGGMGISAQLVDRQSRWINSTEKQLFLVEHWYLKGNAWRYCYYCYNVEFASGVSPFKDEKGKTISRYLMFSANVDHDGDRYGFVRLMKPMQDEINSRRSKALHQMHTRRIIAEKGAVDDVEVSRREAVKPDGYLEVNPGKRFDFDDVSKSQEWQAQIELLGKSETEIENFGPSAALLGTGLNDASGRAIQFLQQAGMAELGPFMTAYKNWKLRVYRALWCAVQSTWTAERWVRVTDSNDVAQFIKLNGLGVDPHTGQPQIVNELGALDVDIILDEGPDVINLMEDTFDALIKLAQTGMQVPPDIIIELSALDSGTKKKILDRLAQAQQQNPLAQQAQQLQLQGIAAKNDETKSKTLKNIAEAHAAVQPDPAQAPQQPQVQHKPPSIAVNYKDMPPEAQSQALAQDGIFIHPAVLAIHAERMKAQDVANKAALASHSAALAPPPMPPQGQPVQ